MTHEDSLHYHLRPSEVTKVVLQQAGALTDEPDPDEVVLLSGTRPMQGSPAPHRIVPGLEYTRGAKTSHIGPDRDGAALADRIERVMRDTFPQGCDVLHVHNPLIRLNDLLIAALKMLQSRGFKLLIQMRSTSPMFFLRFATTGYRTVRRPRADSSPYPILGS